MLLALLTVGAALVLKTPAAPKPKLDAAAIRALPGDPSLVLHTSATLGTEKVAFMKACSKAIATTLSKPETYVCVTPTPPTSQAYHSTVDWRTR